MLQSIRESTSGPFAWIVVAIIVVPFAFFGIETFRSGGGDGTVAKVGDKKITQRELQAGYEQRYQRLQSMMGDSFDPALIQGPQFRRQVLDEMVREQVVTQYAKNAGLRGTDDAVFAYLAEIPAFQTDGAFSPQAYRDTLAANQRQPDAFEAQVADSIAIDQLQRGLIDSAWVAPGEVDLAYRLDHQRRRYESVTIALDDYRESVAVTADEVQARYDEQADRFTTPEQVKLAYIEVNQSQLASDEEPSDEVLREVYEQQKGRFTTAEARKTSHILIKTDTRSSSEAEALAAKARSRVLDDGESFAEVAKSLSEDAGSAVAGGDLDWVERGVMVPTFEDALFALEEGAVSEPVETEFGWHIIKVDEVRAEQTTPFNDESVQARIREIQAREAAGERFQTLTEELETLAYESVDSLEPASQATGLTVDQTGWFSRSGGAGIASNPEVLDAAFSQLVLEQGENSRLIELEPGRVVVVRVADRQPEEQKPFEQVQDQIRAELVNEAARTQAQSAADALIASVEETGSIAAGLAAQGLENPITDSGLIERTDTDGREGARLDPRVVRAVFGKPRRSAGSATGVGQMTTAGGDIVVFRLTTVENPIIPEDGSERSTIASRSSSVAARQEMASWEAAIRDQTKVRVNEDMLAEQAEQSSPY